MTWICCQIGAREHYAIPRALNVNNSLYCLITDAWLKPNPLVTRLQVAQLKGLQGRFDQELQNVTTYAFNYALIGFETFQRLQRAQGWSCTIARNYWFQKQALAKIKAIAKQLDSVPTLFAYSYAALELFQFAKQQGWRTVLGQIDPGLEEEGLVIQENQNYPEYGANWQPAPAHYWQSWQQECQLADHIVVNSQWSKSLLSKAKIPTTKLKIVPLVYRPPRYCQPFQRCYPQAFSQQRPFRVLFLGQIILRKGIAAIFKAIRLLSGHAIEFWLVGAPQVKVPADLQQHPNIRWFGQIPRSQVSDFYQNADLFLFPTLSDGFGLTQLEAQAWRLPILASQCCGEVVKHDENGWLLTSISGETIAYRLNELYRQPELLQHASDQSVLAQHHTLKHLADELRQLER